jgi:hypothetical protein
MDVLALIGVFLLGASAGAVITRIQYRAEISQLRGHLGELQQKEKQNDKAA